jgi:hypothetical protein
MNWKSKGTRLGLSFVALGILGGLAFFLMKEESRQLSILVEANGVIEEFVLKNEVQWEKASGVLLNVRTFQHEKTLDPAKDYKDWLEHDLVLASAETLFDWRTRSWLSGDSIKVADNDFGSAWAIFGWNRPYLASTQESVGRMDISSSLKLRKSGPRARFALTYGTDQNSFLVNLLVNSGSLKIFKAESFKQSYQWDASRLRDTLEAFSKGMHEDIRLPVSCEGDCPLTELLGGNTGAAWLDHSTVKNFTGRQPEAIKSLRPMHGLALIRTAWLARPALNDAKAVPAVQALLTYFSSADFRSMYAASGLEALVESSEYPHVYWQPEDIEDARAFEESLASILKDLMAGRFTPQTAADLLVRL